MRRTILGIALAALCASVAFAGDAPKYKVLNRIKLGGDGGWDYLTVDSLSHRLFISRGTHVMVVNIESGRVVGDIPNTSGVHGIAIAPRLNKGFTSNGRDNTVTVFDLKTLKEVERVPVGTGPDAIVFDQASNRIFTFNGRSSDATAIDAKTDKVVGTVKLGGRPEFPSADGKGKIFVNIEDKSTVQAINTNSLQVLATWPLAPGEGPSGSAYDSRRHVLFSTCDNQMLTVLDTATGKIVGTPKIGEGPDAAAFDSQLRIAFSSNGQSGTLTLVQRKPDGKYVVVQELPTVRTARTMALDPRTHRIYLACAEVQPGGTGDRPHPIPGSFSILVVGP